MSDHDRRRLKAVLPAAFIAFAAVNIVTLNGGHNWGDDFAQYILHAVNLVRHRPYAQNIVLDLWTVVPPGFPLILSAVIYWTGVSFKILKSLNVVFWGLTALAAYFLARRKLDHPWPAMITVWFLNAPSLFFFKQNVLSDIPFLCFATLSVLAFLKTEEEEGSGGPNGRAYYALTLFLMGFAILIRWAGLLLNAAAVLYLVVVRKKYRQSLGYIITALAAAAVNIGFGATVSGHFNASLLMPGRWLHAVWLNAAYVPQVLFEFVVTEPHVSSSAGPAVYAVFKVLGPALLLFFAVLFVVQLSRRKIGFLGCFTFLYMLAVVLWPVQQGVSRYILPAVIPLTVMALQWAHRRIQSRAGQKILVGLFMVLIIQNIAVIASRWNFNDDSLNRPETLAMAQWVSANIAPDEHYMFYKPRALRLLTGRTGAGFWVDPADSRQWYNRIRPLEVTYLITDKELDKISRHDHVRLPTDGGDLTLNVLWQNSRYKIFRVSE